MGIIGLIVMATSTDTQLRYGFAHVCMAGVFVGGPLLAVWIAGNTPWKGTRSVIMGVNGWSNIAGVIAGQLFKTKYRPRCKSLNLPRASVSGLLTIVIDEISLIVTMALMVFGICGLGFLKFMYLRENKKRAREIANWDEADFANEAASRERRGDQKRTLMYGT